MIGTVSRAAEVLKAADNIIILTHCFTKRIKNIIYNIAVDTCLFL